MVMCSMEAMYNTPGMGTRFYISTTEMALYITSQE